MNTLVQSQTLVQAAIAMKKVSPGLATVLFEVAKSQPTGGLKK